jgi:hypothetical protein
MAVLANGLETLEVGATAWRLVINSTISNLYSRTESDNTYFKKVGGTLTGFLVLYADATSALHPITKQQFDAGVTTKALLGVGTTTSTSSAATYTPLMNTYNNFIITLTASQTFANPTGLVVGESGQIILVQDATGSRVITWGTAYKFPGGTKAILSTAPNSVDTFRYFVKSATEVHMYPSLAMA